MKKLLQRNIALLLAVMLTLSFAPFSAFADEGEGGDPVKPPSVELSIALNKSALKLEKGSAEKLTATVTAPDGADITVTWTSDTDAVATVAQDGTVTAVAPGAAIITATATAMVDNVEKTATATCAVTVTPPPATGINLSHSTLTLAGNGTQQLYPADATDPIVWSSANPAVATVSGSGLVTAVSPGKDVYITATAGAAKAICTVTVSGVVLSPTGLRLVSGNSATIEASRFGDAVGKVLEWSSSNSAFARVDANGKVTALTEGTTSIKAQTKDGAYVASCNVTVVRNEAGLVRATLDAGAPLAFSDIESTLRSRGASLTGSSVSYITSLTVPTGQGTLYYQYNSPADTGAGVGGSEKYYVDSTTNGVRRLSGVTFVPKLSFSGEATIGYTGFTVGGASYKGEIVVTVAQTELLNYTTENGEPVTMNADDFSAYSRVVTGRDISYITFSLPAAKYGKLYYDYTSADRYGSAVKSSDRFYRTKNPYISSVSFVPAAGYTGTFTMAYTGYDTSNKSFGGEVRIAVSRRGGDASLTYDARSGSRLYFDVDDLSDASYDATGYQLNYVRFTLPVSSRGILYYNGSTRVSADTSYYRSGSTRPLKDVSFVPDKDFTGTVSIRFTGYDTRGTSFSGTITVNVSDKNTGGLHYTGYSGVRLNFKTDDFSDVSYDETGYELNYVRFTLPASSRGILYYNESTRVSADTSYYRTGSTRLLRDVSFVPDKNFTGTVTIRFTGYNTRGTSFTRELTVEVTRPKAAEVSYYTGGAAVNFQLADFTSACAQALSGTLTGVRLTLPDEFSGKLYYSYAGPSRYESLVTATTYYAASSPYLSRVSFVPRAGYSGTVHLSFTATDNKGGSCTGTIRIAVTSSTYSSSFTDMGNHGWAVPASDFLHRYGVAAGTGAGKYSPAAQIKRGDFILMLSRAFDLKAAGTASFRDVPQNSYYAGALASAKAQGIASGFADGSFRPNDAISRQDAAVMLQRCMLQAGISVGDGSAADLAAFSDRGAVAPYAVGALSGLVRRGILSGNSAGRLMPTSTLTRAEMAVILHRALTL